MKKSVVLFSFLLILISINFIHAAEFCDGADIDRNNKVELADLQRFINELKSNCAHLSPRDALVIINALNNPSTQRKCTVQNNLCNLMDINLDGILSQLDGLIIINLLNSCTVKVPSPQLNSDFNNDKKVNSYDRDIYLGLLKTYPVGTVCDLTCSNDCSPSNVKRCNGINSETCGNYDADPCLEWGNSISCNDNNLCTVDSCISSGSCSFIQKTCQSGQFCDPSSGICKILSLRIFISAQKSIFKPGEQVLWTI